jgi:hypothetical protein
MGRCCYRTLLLNTRTRFPTRSSWGGVPNAIPGLFSGAPVSHLLDSWILRMDARRQNHQAQVISWAQQSGPGTRIDGRAVV